MLQGAGVEVTQPDRGRTAVERQSRLEDRLGRRIVSTVIPQIAQGFLENCRARPATDADPTDAALTETFQSSLVFLYRMLFVLYAESRELLPIREPRYFALSLLGIRDEIAEQGGWARGDVLDRRGQVYSNSETALYDRITRLFQTLEKSRPNVGVAACMGSLFQPASVDAIARFLAEHKVSDRRLAIAIDALCRDQSEPTSTRAFFDFKSLDLQFLGSVHESLLGYKLCSDSDAGANRREKHSGKKGSKPRLDRSSCGKREVYLATHRKRRKASGSYYTPPAIVEYLVANTVGPVLDEKLQVLRSEILAEGEKRAKKRQPLPELFDRLFDLRVIDPAMGCGHFLVEAVDFIASRLLDFVAQFPGFRGEFLRLIAARGRKIAGDASSDRLLVKRYVLERCIYGVDVDPIAVEVAKATLTLSCGILGAPFIIPGDHLRYGDALIGQVVPAETAGPLAETANPRAFDWHREFPEIFAQPRNREAPACGFDCVLGNPPYVRIQNLDDALVEYLEQRFETAQGKFDLSIPFLERGAALLGRNGILGMIVPNKFVTADYGAAFRDFVARNRLLCALVDFGSEQVFPGASTYCCLLFLSRRPRASVAVSRGLLERPIVRETAVVPIAEFGAGPWNVRPDPSTPPTQGVPLHAACRAIFQGLISGADRLLISIRDGDTIRLGADRVEFDPDVFRPVLKGADVRRFALRFSEHYVLYPYRLANGKTELIPEEELASRHPAAYRYLLKHRRELKKRGSPSMAYPAWFAHWCPRNLERFGAPKIVTQVLASRASFALDREGSYTFVGGGNAGVYGLIPQFDEEDRLWVLLAVLNSRIFDAQVQEKSSRFRGGYFSYARRFLQNALIPQIERLDPLAPWLRRIVDLTKSRAEPTPECHNRLEAEIEAAVAELYRCGTR